MTPAHARHGIATCVVLFCLVLAGTLRPEAQAPSAPAPSAPATPQRALIDQYCIGCHNDRVRSGGLALSGLNLNAVHESPEIAEKVIRKLRGGLMPPAGVRRPDSRAVAELVSWLEHEIDAHATAPEPGRVGLRRLNRREYAYAIRDLIGFTVDAKAVLPEDNVAGHFDNNAAALQVSPAFVDQYISAARTVAL